MNKTLKRIAPVSLGLALLTGMAVASPASASPTDGLITGTWLGNPDGYGNGYNNVINGHAANARIVGLDASTENAQVDVYCIVEGQDFDENEGVSFAAATRSQSTAANLAKVADLAARSAAIGTPLENVNSEAAAKQLAIWKLTDNLDISAVPNTDIVNRANELSAGAVDAPETPSSFLLVATPTEDDTTDTLTVTLKTKEGTGITSPIRITGEGVDQTVNTDANGTAVLVLPGTEADRKLNVEFEGTLKAGTILNPSTDSQPVITAEDAPVTRVAEAAFTGTPAVTPPPTTPPTTPPAPVETPPVSTPPAPVNTPVATPPTTNPQELPYTGTWLTYPIIAAAVAAVGGGIFLRRRAAQK